MSTTDVQDATRLILFGLRAAYTPQRDQDYRRLVEYYLDSTAFQEMVHAAAVGLQLKLLEVDPEAGVVLTPSATDSPFAQGLSEYRGSLGSEVNEVPRAAFVIAQVAVSSAFYPSADSIEYPDPQPPSITVTEVCERAVELSRCLQRRLEEDPEEVESSMQPGWRHILSLPMELPLSERPSPSSLRGLMTLVLRKLGEQRLVIVQERRAEQEPFYVATPRYRIILLHNSGSLLRVLHKILESQPAGAAAGESG